MMHSALGLCIGLASLANVAAITVALTPSGT
jgi:hypothetical protein